MDNEILTTIISLEHEIQERLSAEEQSAARMLQLLREELEEEARQEEDRLQAAGQVALARASREAEAGAEALLLAARAKAKLLEELTDDTLRECVGRHLVKLLPERER